MKICQTILSSATFAGLSLFAGNVLAQGVSIGGSAKASTEAPPQAEGEAVAQPAEAPVAEPVAVPAPEPAAPAAVEPIEEVAPAPIEAQSGPAVEAVEPVAEEVEVAVEEESGGASLFVFADAWAGFQTAKSGPGAGGGVYANNGPAGNANSGFGMNWLGADLGYDGGQWAVNGSLRWGDAVSIYGTGTLGPITNAYVTWRPVDGLALDVGTFGTIYGAEVAESWQNLNYTRGELYFNMQPFWHTGLRAEYATGDLVFRALVVNDANTSNLDQGALNLGLQAGYDNGTFGLIAGALQSLKPETTLASGGFVDTFVDVVLTVNAGDFSLVGNFDLNAGYEASSFWGASLAAGYAFSPAFGMALRGEYLSSNDGFLYGSGSDDLITGTLTFDTKPVPGVENFVLRWDNRIEFASEDVYSNLDASDVTDKWFSSTLGFVAYADLL